MAGWPLDRTHATGHDLLTRRTGRTVQGCPLASVYWADIPPGSVRVRGRPLAWQHCWQQYDLLPVGSEVTDDLRITSV